MLSLNFKPFPALTTQRLQLREMNQQDTPEIFFLRSDPEMLRYLDRDAARSHDEAARWIQMIVDSINDNETIAWAISLKSHPRLIGTITFWNIRKEHHRAEIGYSLHTSYQGKGLMQEAMTAVLEYGFSTMKLHSVEANVNPANTASIRLLERNNFVREAYHHENYYHNGKFLDSAIYSLITPSRN